MLIVPVPLAVASMALALLPVTVPSAPPVPVVPSVMVPEVVSAWRPMAFVPVIDPLPVTVKLLGPALAKTP